MNGLTRIDKQSVVEAGGEESGSRKKEMLRPGSGLVIVCVALRLDLLALPVLAAVAYTCSFSGTADVAGEPVAADTNVTAWAGREQLGSVLTDEGSLAGGEFTLRRTAELTSLRSVRTVPGSFFDLEIRQKGG